MRIASPGDLRRRCLITATTSAWGPTVALGLVGGQVIGAATFNDRLHLVYTSYAPVTGPLDQIKAELSGALGNVY